MNLTDVTKCYQYCNQLTDSHGVVNLQERYEIPFLLFHPTGWNSNYSLYKTNQKKGGHAGMHGDGASISKGEE